MMHRTPHLVKNLLRLNSRTIQPSVVACYCTDKKQNAKNPLIRTANIFKDDLRKLRRTIQKRNPFNSNKEGADHNDSNDEDLVQSSLEHYDVVIIGGGGVGSSIAYWLKERARHGLRVAVIERDSTYKTASTVLSVGGLRQQFSLPENIEMSLFGAEFIRNIKEYLGDVEVNFTPYGYLTLASEEGAETLIRNSKLQNQLGARNELLNPDKLKTKFPWINTEGIALGCHGLENEGWFDPWALLFGFKQKAKEYGADFINGEVVGFEFREQPDIIQHGINVERYVGLDKVVVKISEDQTHTIQFAICVLAAGPNSGRVAEMAGIGKGEGLLSIPLPVEPRKRYVYVINSQGYNAPGLCTPLTIDPDGTYFRRDGLGGNYLCGRSPATDQEPTVDNLDVDHEYFETDVWPTIAKRCTAFESAKVVNSWAGFYEYNMFDENGIIGFHPYYSNMVIATGFSGHGIQQTPAVGRAITELITDGRFRTIDLTRLSFDRIIVDRPMLESNIV